jgi:hypothetical protein
MKWQWWISIAVVERVTMSSWVRWRTEPSRRGYERNKVKAMSLKLHDVREECGKGDVGVEAEEGVAHESGRVGKKGRSGNPESVRKARKRFAFVRNDRLGTFCALRLDRSDLPFPPHY